MTHVLINPAAIPHFFVGAVLLGLGLFVFFKNRRAPLNQWFVLLCCSMSFWYIGLGLSLQHPTDLSRYFLWQKIAHFAVIFTPTSYFAVTVRLLRLERFQVVAWLYHGFAAAMYATMWLTPFYFNGEVYRYWWGVYPKATPLLTAHAMTTVSCVVLCYRFFLRAHRQAKREGQVEEYHRFKYFCVALAFFGLAPMDYLPKYGIGVYPFGCLFTLAFALIMTYAILKHHVMDITIVVQRGLVYSTLVAGMTLIYLLSVLLTEKLFQGFLGYHSLIASILAAFIIAVGFIPFRNLAQRFIDHAVFRGSLLELVRQRERLLVEIQKTDHLKAVATLAAELAHEIKNPLTAIKTFATYLPQKADDPVFRQKFQRIVTQEVDKVDGIVHRLLDFAKAVHPQFQPTTLSQLLEETLDFLNSDCLKRRVSIQRAYATPGLIQADPQQLRQVFLNLCLNSLDAMEHGGTLSVGTAAENSHLNVTIADTGKGISKAHQAKLFDPFFTTKPNGTGLGLTIVRDIVREHGGTITLESPGPGRGTRCTLTFPLSPTHGCRPSFHDG